MIRTPLIAGLFAATVAASLAPAQTATRASGRLFVPAEPVIYATGQLFIPGDRSLPSTDDRHYDHSENAVYRIDIRTGVATAVSPAMTTDLPSGLAGTPSGDIFGFASGFASGREFGRLVRVDPVSGAQTNIGQDIGLRSSALDITAAGLGFILPFNAASDTQQLHAIDLATGSVTPIGSATAIGDAIDLARGTPLGTAEPFVISLGSVGNVLYGVDADSESLVSIDSTTGAVGIVGAIGAVGAANGGGYSGFSALTGVDEDMDGDVDALFGSVNQVTGASGAERLGGIARFDLTSGAWSLIGTNPGIVFFGFGLAPAPATDFVAADLDTPSTPRGFADIGAFVTAFVAEDETADLDGNGVLDHHDISGFVEAYDTCCP